MHRDDLLRTLKSAESDLRARGVAHAALFGSSARGDTRAHSDIDVMVEIAPDAVVGVFAFIQIVHALEALFPVQVDVSDREAMKVHVRPTAERDAIYAF